MRVPSRVPVTAHLTLLSFGMPFPVSPSAYCVLPPPLLQGRLGASFLPWKGCLYGFGRANVDLTFSVLLSARFFFQVGSFPNGPTCPPCLPAKTSADQLRGSKQKVGASPVTFLLSVPGQECFFSVPRPVTVILPLLCFRIRRGPLLFLQHALSA